MSNPVYRRVLLKLSGEVLAGKQGFGIEQESTDRLVSEVKSIYDLGIEIGIIIGAGNIFRGMQVARKGGDRVTGDHLGMLGTVMNAISFREALEKAGCKAVAMSAFGITGIIEQYVRGKVQNYLKKGKIVLVAGGTGNPFFTTDSAAALRAAELGMDVVLKGTKVPGVFDKDPMVHDDAVRYDEIAFNDVITRNLRVMDLTAITLCKENKIPIIVFNIHNSGDLKKTVQGMGIGTLVRE